MILSSVAVLGQICLYSAASRRRYLLLSFSFTSSFVPCSSAYVLFFVIKHPTMSDLWTQQAAARKAAGLNASVDYRLAKGAAQSKGFETINYGQQFPKGHLQASATAKSVAAAAAAKSAASHGLHQAPKMMTATVPPPPKSGVGIALGPDGNPCRLGG